MGGYLKSDTKVRCLNSKNMVNITELTKGEYDLLLYNKHGYEVVRSKNPDINYFYAHEYIKIITESEAELNCTPSTLIKSLDSGYVMAGELLVNDRIFNCYSDNYLDKIIKIQHIKLVDKIEFLSLPHINNIITEDGFVVNLTTNP